MVMKWTSARCGWAKKGHLHGDSFPAREFPGKVVAIYTGRDFCWKNVVYYDVVVEIQGNEDRCSARQMEASVTIFLDADRRTFWRFPARRIKRERGKERGVRGAGRASAQPREVKVGMERRNVDRGRPGFRR